MKAFASMFRSADASWQVERGLGVRVKVTNVGEQHVGRGLYCELNRDHTWLYISRITPLPGGQIEVEYLEVKSSQHKTTDGCTCTEVTEEQVIAGVAVFEENEDIVLHSKPPGERPRGRRVTVTTTVKTEELLEV